ncbi:hypothetical protein IWQ60_007123 [Tieghemiomyces parasiticus]|uniref:DASH complex subunit DUO1 n=1 Tax=Tieghemiomyces parasiticus TaxID=78921 RepID=A0A9W8A648_9FUNG|nr:hypothetical protein IWQ60_007123 [Tieghemiomyces parasiticus]
MSSSFSPSMVEPDLPSQFLNSEDEAAFSDGSASGSSIDYPAKHDESLSYDAEASDEHVPDEALQAELASLQQVNKTLEVLRDGLATVVRNVQLFHGTITQTKELVGMWGDLFSETHRIQSLYLDPTWQGATKDRETLERRRQEEEQRRIDEEAEAQRLAAEQARAEVEQQARLQAPQPATKPVRGRATRGKQLSGNSCMIVNEMAIGLSGPA